MEKDDVRENAILQAISFKKSIFCCYSLYVRKYKLGLSRMEYSYEWQFVSEDKEKE